MAEIISEYLRNFKDEWATLAAIATVVLFFFGVFRWLLVSKAKKQGGETHQPNRTTTNTGDGYTQIENNYGTVHSGLTFEQHEASLKNALDRKTADLERAHGAERELLQRQIDNLQRQLADPQTSLLEAQKRIKDLETLLDREGNDIGAERIEAAKAALEQGDYSLADDLFAEIEARAEPEVQRASRAAYGRGEVAEAEVRWHDAAKHYARAAQLDPSFDTLLKASEFAGRSGDYKAALRHGENLLKLAESGELTETQKARAYNEHALTLKAKGQYEAAEQLFRQAMAIGENTLGVDHPSYAIGLNNLANVLEAQGQYEMAEQLYRQALAIDEKTVGVDHPDYAIDLNNLAEVLRAQGQYAAAEEYCRQALAIDEKTIGVDHPDYATRLNNLAGVLEAQGRHEAAEGYCRQAMAIGEKTIGVDHPNYALGLNNLALVLMAQGQYATAEQHFRQALAIDEKTIGVDHPEYASRLNNLALVLYEQGQYAAAEEHCRQALAIDEKTIGVDHPDYATHLNNLAGVLEAQGQYEAAEEYYRQAIQIFESALGDTHPNTIQARENLEFLLANSSP